MVECLLYWLGFVYDLMVYIRFICLLYLIDVSESPRDKRKANKNGWTRLVTFYESEFRDKSALILRLIIHLPLNSALKIAKNANTVPTLEVGDWRLFVFCLYPHLYQALTWLPFLFFYHRRYSGNSLRGMIHPSIHPIPIPSVLIIIILFLKLSFPCSNVYI